MQTKIKVFMSRQEDRELITRTVNHVIEHGGSFSLEHTLECGNVIATYTINWPDPPPVEIEVSKTPEVVTELEREISQLEMEKAALEHKLEGFRKDAEMFRYVAHPDSDVGFSVWNSDGGRWEPSSVETAIIRIERGILKEKANAE